MAEDQTTLEAKVRRLEDLEEIRQLLEDYAYHLDRGHWKEYAALYATDGKMRLGPVRGNGRAEIEQAARDGFGHGRDGDDTRLGGLHLITSPRIELDGDRATTEVMWTVLVPGADGTPTIGSLGHHADELVREDGRWRFAVRKGFIDIPHT